jgi:hypothetical protein
MAPTSFRGLEPRQQLLFGRWDRLRGTPSLRLCQSTAATGCDHGSGDAPFSSPHLLKLKGLRRREKVVQVDVNQEADGSGREHNTARYAANASSTQNTGNAW